MQPRPSTADRRVAPGSAASRPGDTAGNACGLHGRPPGVDWTPTADATALVHVRLDGTPTTGAELTLATRCRRRRFSALVRTPDAGTETRASETTATFEVPLSMLHRKGLRARVRVGGLNRPIDLSELARLGPSPPGALRPLAQLATPGDPSATRTAPPPRRPRRDPPCGPRPTVVARARSVGDGSPPIVIDPTLLQFLPYEQAAPRLAVPIGLEGDVLTVAVALPSVDLSVVTDHSPWLRIQRVVTDYHRIVQALREVEAMHGDASSVATSLPRHRALGVLPDHARGDVVELLDDGPAPSLGETRTRSASGDDRSRAGVSANPAFRRAVVIGGAHERGAADGTPRRQALDRPWQAAAGIVAGIAAAVGLMLVSPQQSAVPDLSARVAADTTACVGALVAAYLALACYRIRRSAGSLALAAGLGTFALTTALAVAGVEGRSTLPIGALADALSAPSALLVAQVACLVMLAAAALGLALRSRGTDERLRLWCAVGVLWLAIAQCNALLATPDPASWISQADVFRLAAIASFLVGAARQLVAHGRELASDAVVAERRRMARELHDGVAQELAFIVSQASSLARNAPPSSPMQSIALAGERALLDSRRSIQTLTRPDPATLRANITEQATRCARRAGLELELRISEDVETSSAVHHAIQRIVQEAISNAVRHAGATRVTVDLSQRDGSVTVRISDDGRGFDARRSGGQVDGGFGLVSMAERAEAFGGQLRLESEPGRGTIVEVAFG